MDYSTWETGAGLGVISRLDGKVWARGFVVFFVFRHFEKKLMSQQLIP